jgi:hypothetical protein
MSARIHSRTDRAEAAAAGPRRLAVAVFESYFEWTTPMTEPKTHDTFTESSPSSPGLAIRQATVAFATGRQA